MKKLTVMLAAITFAGLVACGPSIDPKFVEEVKKTNEELAGKKAAFDATSAKLGEMSYEKMEKMLKDSLGEKTYADAEKDSAFKAEMAALKSEYEAVTGEVNNLTTTYSSKLGEANGFVEGLTTGKIKPEEANKQWGELKTAIEGSVAANDEASKKLDSWAEKFKNQLNTAKEKFKKGAKKGK